MNHSISSIVFLTPLMLASMGSAAIAVQAPDASCLPESVAQDGATSSFPGGFFEYVEEGGDDPASLPVTDGIVWYGTWEAAMAERERTGKPVMLHMGSVRDRVTNVPGVW